MKKNYFNRGMLLLGAMAFVGMAQAKYVDVTRQYIKDPTFVPEWQGSIGAVNEGVCETWNSAFQTYQNLGDMPAGKYVLTVNAFYRCGNNDYARDNQIGNPDLNTCYIFINDAKQTVAPLQDGRENAPNSMWEANQAFEAGEYLNTVEYNHKGGELVIGIRNTGCYWDEWCCFDNFKLTCDGVDVPVANGNFEEGLNAKRSWNNKNSGGSEKTPDAQKDGSGGGDYRKCGGSPYNTAQQVTLPAGTYRFGMQCFHRYGATVDAEGNYYGHKWPMGKLEPYGSMKRTPKDWFEANDYDQVGDEYYAHAYIFMSMNEEKPKLLAWSGSEADGDLNEATDVRTRVRDCWEICNGDLSIMPQNNPMCLCVDNPDYNPVYEQKNKVIWGNDSGSEREAGAAFVNDPEKWYQYVEFTLDEETTVWLGLGKDGNTGDGYWHAYANIRLEVYEEDPEPEVDPLAITADWWHEWNNYDGSAEILASDLAYCGVRLNEPLNGGEPFAGVLNGTVPGNVYANFTQYAGIYVKGTPGTPWRGLFNRQSMFDEGDYKNVVVNLDENGEAYIMFSQIPELQDESYIHLNTVKMNWGASECVITKFNYISTTGIDNVIVTKPYDNKMYNLQGIEVNDSYKGLVIKNGVKFINR